MISVLIPSIGRADRVSTIVDNIDRSTTVRHEVVFVTEADHVDAYAAVMVGQSWDNVSLIVNERAPNYSGAINTGIASTADPFVFLGADDLEFTDGWDTAALAHMDGWIGVVGTNDLLNPYVLAGAHSTHSLVARWYIDEIGGTVDGGPGICLPEVYFHNYTDTEFIGTAKMRARFRPCLESVVRHMHWSAGLTQRDSVTDEEEATLAADSATYDARRELWFNISR